MAQRQLSSLVRRIRRPLFCTAPVYPRTFLHAVEVQQRVSEDLCFYKLGSRFYSGSSSQKRPGGKVTSSVGKVVSSQGQSSGSHVVGAEKAAQCEPESSPAKQSPSSTFLVVGAFSALVIALLAFFPWDVLKSYYVGEKKDLDVFQEDPKTIDKGAVLSSSENLEAGMKSSEAGKENHDNNGPKHSHGVKTQDSSIGIFEPHTQTLHGERDHPQSAEHIESVKESAFPAESESIAIKNVSPDDSVGEKLSTVIFEESKPLETELKDGVIHLNGSLSDKLPKEDILSKDNLSLTPSGNEKPLPIFSEQILGLEKDSVDENEARQLPSRTSEKRPSLLEAYYLGTSSSTSLRHNEPGAESKESLISDTDEIEKVREEDLRKVHGDKVQTAVEVLELVHAAEIRQAELDAHLYEEAQRKLKQVFQRELKDAQAREVMYAEEASRLSKEIELEREQAVAALKLEQKMAKEKLVEELKRKEEETDLKLKKVELLSKTETAAAVAEEKLSYIKDVRNVKQELEALHMVLSTQSKETQQSHTIHKLAVVTFALEDAMKRGAPVEKEVNLIRASYKDGGPDPLLDAAISSLPKETAKRGTMTPPQLQQQFETLKNGVLELSLIPATGGGLISHAAAKLVAALKVKESGLYSDGVDAVVSQVQSFLADGKLADAADLLEKGVQGTEAEILVADWIKSVRDRAIMEQMLLLLQAHATAAASSVA